MSFFPERWGGREIPLHKIPTKIPKNKLKKNKNMEKLRIEVKSEFEKRSDLELVEFINTVKESFEDVSIISIENLKTEYSKFHRYKYKVSFYHKLYIMI